MVPQSKRMQTLIFHSRAASARQVALVHFFLQFAGRHIHFDDFHKLLQAEHAKIIWRVRLLPHFDLFLYA